MKNKILITLFLLFSVFANAQTDTVKVYQLKIEDAIQFALDNNLKVKNSELEIRKSKWKVWETTAIGLPQVSGAINYTYFPDIAVQLIPNFLAPDPTTAPKIPLKFGTSDNADYGFTISQIIFNGEYIVGLQAANTFKLISEQSSEKAKIELTASIQQAYFLVLIAKQSLEILQNNYTNIKTIAESSQKSADIGMIDQTQADQVAILELNIENQINTIKRQKQLAIYMLNFQLGIDPQDSVVLLTDLDQFKSTFTLDEINQSFNPQNNIDYQMMNTQVKLKELEYKQSMSKFLPSINAFYSYSNKAMLDEFSFFDKSTTWYKTTMVGAKLSIPIFSSGQRYAATVEKKIELTESLNQQNMFNQQLDIQYLQAKNDFLNAFETLISQEKNKNLSEKIYNNTLIKYSQGTSSNVDLTQAQNQYLQAEANYYQALMQLLSSKINFEKLLNQ